MDMSYANGMRNSGLPLNTCDTPPTFPVLQSAINEIAAILNHARDLHIRQINLADRLFGCSPCLAGGIKGMATEKAQGALPEMEYLLSELRQTLEAMNDKLNQLERIA